MTEGSGAGEGGEANRGVGAGPLLRSLEERAPLTVAECEFIADLSGQGFEISGLTLARDERTGAVFVQQMLAPAAQGPRASKGRGIDLGALGAEGRQARERGRFDVAIPCLMLALRLRLRVSPLDDPHTLMSLNDLGETLHDHGDLAGARELLETMHDACLRSVGADHDHTLCAANNLAAVLFDQGALPSACELQQVVYSTLRRKRGATDEEALAAANNLANMLLARGDIAGAHAQILSVHLTLKDLCGAEHPDVLVSANSLAKVLLARGELAEARLLLESTLETQRRVEGPRHIRTLATANNLGEVLRSQGDLKEAHRLHRYAYEMRREVLGAGHMDTLASANNLALTLRDLGKRGAARALLQTVYEDGCSTRGAEHPDSLAAALNLAEALRDAGDLPGALKLQTIVHETCERLFGEEHPQTLLAANNRAGTLQMAGELAESGRLHERTHKILHRVLGPAHTLTVGSAQNRAVVCQAQGNLSKCAEICLSALDALTNAIAVDSAALVNASGLPILQFPDLAWPVESITHVIKALPALSLRVLRQLRSMTLDSGASLFKALLMFHERWCAFIHHHAPAQQQPELLLTAIGALHGTNTWAQLRALIQDTDAQGRSLSARRYLRNEQELQKTQQEILDLIQQRDALRERGATGELLRPLAQKLEALSRLDTQQHRSLIEAEGRLAAEDPVFAEQIRVSGAVDWQTLQDSVEDEEVWLTPLPQEVVQLSDQPTQWAEQLGGRSSWLYVVRRSGHPSIVPIAPLAVLAEATRLYRQGMQGASRGLMREGVQATSTAAQHGRGNSTDAAAASRSGDEWLALVRHLSREGFWAPLLPMLAGVRRLHLVTGPGQHDMMLECGLPDELAHLQVLRYCGLPAYRQRLMTDPGEVSRSTGHGVGPLPELAWMCDPAWNSGSPIPFTTLDVLVPRLQGRGSEQDVQALLANGPHSPLLVISSHGQSSGSRDNPSGAILIGDVRLGASMLAARRPTDRSQVQRPARFVIALSCFGGVVGSSSQGDAQGVIAALQGYGMRWAIACLAPVADFYTPLFSAILHHELGKTGAVPSNALVRTKQLVRQGPWDEALRREALDPLRHGYRQLMRTILDEALSLSTINVAVPQPNSRALPLLRSLLGWPIAGKVQRLLVAALTSAHNEGQSESTALQTAQGQIRDLLHHPSRRDAFVDDALDALFAGPEAWAKDREDRGPIANCVAALDSLCAITVFFGHG